MAERFYRTAEGEAAGYQIPSPPTDAWAEIERAINGVLFHVSNFPEPAQARLLGQDMGPLRTKLVNAVIDALDGQVA